MWLEVEINILSIVNNMKQSNMYVDCISKDNRYVNDFQFYLLFMNHFWIQFKVKCESSLSDCSTKKWRLTLGLPNIVDSVSKLIVTTNRIVQCFAIFFRFFRLSLMMSGVCQYNC